MINIYVTEARDDKKKEDGSKMYPYTSIEKAKNHISQITTDEIKEHIQVNVLEGKYFLKNPIIFTEKDSGTDKHPITYKAQGKVEISGSKVLTNLIWNKDKKNPNILVAQTDKEMQIEHLFIDKKQQIMARYPKYNPKASLDGATTIEKIKKRSKRWKNPEGGYIRALHDKLWGGNSYKIIGKNPYSEIGLDYTWVGDNNRGSKMADDQVMVENIREELESPGEWFYDRKSGKLYVYPEKGTEFEKACIEVALQTELFKFVGKNFKEIREEKIVKNIILEGFTYFGTKRTLFTIEDEEKEYVPLLRGDWCVVRAGAIYLKNSKKITIKNCEFKDIGSNAIFLDGYNEQIKIKQNEFVDIGATCVQVIGRPDAVYEPSFWEHEHYNDREDFTIHKKYVDFPECVGPRTEGYPRSIFIECNHMKNLGIYEKQSSGINLSVSKDVKILRNTIHECPRANININDGTFGGHEIAHNDIYHAQRETEDHGPFNSWGRDRFWSVPEFNAGGHHGEKIRMYKKNGKEYDLSKIDAVSVTKIHDNRFYHDSDYGPTFGIDLDDGSSYYEIYNNLGLGIGIKLREGFNRKVYNNIFVGGKIDIHCTYRQAKDWIKNNIIINKEPWRFAGQTDGEEKRVTKGEYTINNNWYFYPGELIELPKWFDKYGYDKNSISNEDPKFANAKENDYTIGNSAIFDKINFKPFSMDQFGKPDCKEKSPIYFLEKDKNIERKKIKRKKWSGAIISTIDVGIMSSTASKGTRGVYLEIVPEPSLAYKLGLRERDIIKTINGIEIIGIKDFLKNLGNQAITEEIHLSIYRRNKIQKINLAKKSTEEHP